MLRDARLLGLPPAELDLPLFQELEQKGLRGEGEGPLYSWLEQCEWAPEWLDLVVGWFSEAENASKAGRATESGVTFDAKEELGAPEDGRHETGGAVIQTEEWPVLEEGTVDGSVRVDETEEESLDGNVCADVSDEGEEEWEGGSLTEIREFAPPLESEDEAEGQEDDQEPENGVSDSGYAAEESDEATPDDEAESGPLTFKEGITSDSDPESRYFQTGDDSLESESEADDHDGSPGAKSEESTGLDEGFGVPGEGFGVPGAGFGVSGEEFGAPGDDFGMSDDGLSVSDEEFDLLGEDADALEQGGVSWERVVALQEAAQARHEMILILGSLQGGAHPRGVSYPKLRKIYRWVIWLTLVDGDKNAFSCNCVRDCWL